MAMCYISHTGKHSLFIHTAGQQLDLTSTPSRASLVTTSHHFTNVSTTLVMRWCAFREMSISTQLLRLLRSGLVTLKAPSCSLVNCLMSQFRTRLASWLNTVMCPITWFSALTTCATVPVTAIRPLIWWATYWVMACLHDSTNNWYWQPICLPTSMPRCLAHVTQVSSMLGHVLPTVLTSTLPTKLLIRCSDAW